MIVEYNRANNKINVDDNLAKRGYTKEQLDVLKKKMNKGDLASLNSCGVKIKGDLSEFISPYFNYLFEMYELYEKGAMPFKGPPSDQPAQIIEAFNILRRLEVETQKERIKEQEKEIKRQNGKR